MATPWCRLWADLPNDPKWRTISKVSSQPISAVVAVYVHLLICASNANERGRTQGWSDEDVASALDLDTDQVKAICDAMQGRVLEGDQLSGWNKRQPAREDGAAERSKSWRNNKKQKETEGSERNRTQPNADKRPEVEVEVEVDKNKDKKKVDKIPFAQNVLLKQAEYETLVDKHGEQFVDACIEKLDSYKEAKGKKYASDYGAIRSWVIDEVAKNAPPQKATSYGQTDEELREKGLIE